MESSQTTLLEYSPFPRNSVNCVVGPTNIGKSYFVSQLLNNYKVFFHGPVDRILVILCNDRVQPLNLTATDVAIEQIPLSEYLPDILQANDLVVIDDLQNLTEPIKHTINVSAHHYNLVALFVVTHALLGDANFSLTSRIHRLFLFTNSSANIRSAKYVIDNFYQDEETKKYLKRVLGFCESENQILALELSALAKNRRVILAFSHVTNLLDKQFMLLYPVPHWGQQYTANFKHSVTKMESFEVPPNLPEPTLVVVPMAAVVKAKAETEAKKEVKCSDKRQWEETIREIEDNIESYFPPPRWQKIKNLAKEILRNPNFCVKTDGKTFHLIDRPRTQVAMIDFLAVATRRAAPMERNRDPTWKYYSMHVETLLKNNAPRDLFKNKLLIPKRYQE